MNEAIFRTGTEFHTNDSPYTIYYVRRCDGFYITAKAIESEKFTFNIPLHSGNSDKWFRETPMIIDRKSTRRHRERTH